MNAARRVLFCHTEKQLPPLRRLPADAAPRARRLCLADATNSGEGAAAGAAAGAQCCAQLSLTPCFVCSNGASSVPSSTGGSVEKRPQSPSSADPSSSSKRLRASASAPSGVMGAIGDSAKRNSARAHAKNMLDTMVTTRSHPSNPRAVFDKLTGAELCNRSVFERFAGWLTDEESGYKFRDGFEKDGRTPKFSHLMASSCVNYLQDLMHCVKVKFIISGTVEQRLFLQCTVKVCLHLRFCASLDFHAHEFRAATHNAVDARYRGGDVPPTAIGGTSPPGLACV